jgi:hypothetical protein
MVELCDLSSGLRGAGAARSTACVIRYLLRFLDWLTAVVTRADKR